MMMTVMIMDIPVINIATKNVEKTNAKTNVNIDVKKNAGKGVNINVTNIATDDVAKEVRQVQLDLVAQVLPARLERELL
jgi:hypothetical protein